MKRKKTRPNFGEDAPIAAFCNEPLEADIVDIASLVRTLDGGSLSKRQRRPQEFEWDSNR